MLELTLRANEILLVRIPKTTINKEIFGLRERGREDVKGKDVRRNYVDKSTKTKKIDETNTG